MILDATGAHAGMGVAAAFSCQLYRWRTAKGLPIKALAQALGVSASTISAWENGSRFPSVNHVATLASYMNLPACKLVQANEKFCGFCKRCEPIGAVSQSRA